MSTELQVALAAYKSTFVGVVDGIAWLFRRIVAPWTVDAKLYQSNVLLRKRLEAAELENSLLAEVNENLRRWLVANTAAAVQVGKSLGYDDVKRSS